MIIKRAYIASGMGLGVLARMLYEKGTGFGLGSLLRLAILLVIGVMTTVQGAAAFFFQLSVRRRPVRPDPIIIVGHWRTGSTYLHELLALDSNLGVPTTLLCTSPRAFPVSRLFMAPVMALATRGTRPMDNVRIGPYTPQEDEFALFRLTGFSPMKGLLYPPRSGYFLGDTARYLPSDGRGLRRFEAALRFVMRAVQGREGRRPVLKNPCHTLRIPYLRTLFPEAIFIHIRRDPVAVIPSTMRMWSLLGAQNTLRGTWRDPSVEEVAAVYNRIERSAEVELTDLPPGRRVEVSYARLVSETETVLSEIYAQIGMPVSDALRRSWAARVAQAGSYKKNRYTLTEEEVSRIRASVEGA